MIGKDFIWKISLSGVSLWAWGLGTPSHICKQMKQFSILKAKK
jgi:hypothetical protein